MFSPLLHRLQELCLHAAAPVSRRHVRVTSNLLIEALPTLGSVLYVPMHPRVASNWAMPRGLLIEAMQLAPLLHIRTLVASSAIGVDGPREWLDGLDGAGHPCARLYLLPDTDYFAWDALLEHGEPSAPSARRIRHARPASAQLLRFHLRRMAGMDVLGAAAPLRTSSLSAHVAEHIARAEALAWQPRTDS